MSLTGKSGPEKTVKDKRAAAISVGKKRMVGERRFKTRPIWSQDGEDEEVHQPDENALP